MLRTLGVRGQICTSHGHLGTTWSRNGPGQNGNGPNNDYVKWNEIIDMDFLE